MDVVVSLNRVTRKSTAFTYSFRFIILTILQFSVENQLVRNGDASYVSRNTSLLELLHYSSSVSPSLL